MKNWLYIPIFVMSTRRGMIRKLQLLSLSIVLFSLPLPLTVILLLSLFPEPFWKFLLFFWNCRLQLSWTATVSSPANNYICKCLSPKECGAINVPKYTHSPLPASFSNMHIETILYRAEPQPMRCWLSL